MTDDWIRVTLATTCSQSFLKMVLRKWLRDASRTSQRINIVAKEQEDPCAAWDCDPACGIWNKPSGLGKCVCRVQTLFVKGIKVFLDLACCCIKSYRFISPGPAEMLWAAQWRTICSSSCDTLPQGFDNSHMNQKGNGMTSSTWAKQHRCNGYESHSKGLHGASSHVLADTVKFQGSIIRCSVLPKVFPAQSESCEDFQEVQPCTSIDFSKTWSCLVVSYGNHWMIYNPRVPNPKEMLSSNLPPSKSKGMPNENTSWRPPRAEGV